MSNILAVLLKNTFIYTIGNFGAKILVFLLLPFFTFYLSKSELGTYDIVLTIVSLCIPIVTLQLSDAVYRWLLITSKDDIFAKKVVISSGFFLSLFGLIIFQLFYLIFNIFSYNPYFIYVSLLVITSSLFAFFQNVIRGLKKTKLYASISIFQALLLLGINILCLTVLNLKLEAVFLSNIIANFLAIFVLLIYAKLYRYINRIFVLKKTIKELLKFSIPLVPNAISWWIVNAMNKLIILYMLSAEANGIYAVSSRFPTIITLFNSVFILAWQDHTITAEISSENSKLDSKIFDKYVNFQMSLTLLLIASSELVIYLFVSEEFYDAYKYIPFLYLSAAFSAFSGYYGAAYLREQKTIGIFTSSLIAGILNIGICAGLVKFIGLYAASIGTLVGFIVMFLIRIKETKKYFYLIINKVKIAFLTLLCIIFSILIILNVNCINYILIVVSIFLFIFLNKEMLYTIKNTFSQKNK